MKCYNPIIDGEQIEGIASLDVLNPATGKVFASIDRASREQAISVIATAKVAQVSWAKNPVSERRKLLHKLADAIQERALEIATILVKEQGKPLPHATGEVQYATTFVRYFADMEIPTEVVQDDQAMRVEVHHKPLGVVVGITPWNFPFLIPVYKLAPSLLMGNAFILKPAPTTPLSAAILAEIAADIFPKGLVSLVVDDNELGPVFSEHPDVAKISFTGSTPTGRRIMEASASTLKRLTLELGGNDAGIVLADADIEKTARAVTASAFGNAGQVCIALKRLYVPEAIYEPMIQALAIEIGKIKVGDGLDQGSSMGPVQNKMQYSKAKDYLAIAKRDGRIVVGGNAPEGDGLFVEPTLVRDISDGSPLVDEEQFAPILPVICYSASELDAVIERINASEFGLGGSVWSSNIPAAVEIAHKIESGTVWINQHSHLAPHIPFGGAKQSGLGREFGPQWMLEFSQTVVISVAR